MKGLKVAVAVMGVLIVFGTIALVVVIAQRLATASTPAAAEFQTVTAAVADGRIHLVQRSVDGDERLLTLDAETGRVVNVAPIAPAAE